MHTTTIMAFKSPLNQQRHHFAYHSTYLHLDRDRWAFSLLMHVSMATSLVDPSFDLCQVAAHVAIYVWTGSIFCGVLTAWRRGIWLLGHALLSCHCLLDGPHYIAFYWLLSTHVMTIHATSSYLSHFSPLLEMPLLCGRCVTAVSSGLFSRLICERKYSH